MKLTAVAISSSNMKKIIEVYSLIGFDIQLTESLPIPPKKKFSLQSFLFSQLALVKIKHGVPFMCGKTLPITG